MQVSEIKKIVEEQIAEMYDHRDFDFVMEQLLSRVDNSLDKREGSVIWDALAPVAIEFVIAYYELKTILLNSFGVTATREYLILRGLDRGVKILEARPSVVKGEFDVDLPPSCRFNFNQLNFSKGKFIEEKDGFFYYELNCEQVGRIGNIDDGDLTPIDDISGLKHARIVGVLVLGEEEEDTEEFRQRYFDDIERKDYGGNIDDYERKVKEIQGVGAVKVYPIWNGGGTVKLVIQDSEFGTPSEEMIDRVQEIIDPIPNQGKGIGVAPIGHIVTVEGAKTEEINISMSLSLEAGAEESVIKDTISRYIESYLSELAKEWEDNRETVVRISQIESRVLDIEGVLDITETTINGSPKNLALEQSAIPTMGAVVYV